MTQLGKDIAERTGLIQKQPKPSQGRKSDQPDAPETAGEEQDGFEGSLIERQKRRQDNIESFDDPHEREDLK
jgi:hypothetical protein